MRHMIRTVTLAAAFLLTTALAAQANALNDHWKRPSLDPGTVQTTGESTSPGDPFLPTADNGQNSEGGQTSPYTLTCEGFVNRDGSWTVLVTNNGAPIPPGNGVIVYLPGHQQMNWKVSTKWLPGTARDMSFTENDFLPAGGKFDCTASVHLEQDSNYDPGAPK
jgi:hypothetical protein